VIEGGSRGRRLVVGGLVGRVEDGLLSEFPLRYTKQACIGDKYLSKACFTRTTERLGVGILLSSEERTSSRFFSLRYVDDFLLASRPLDSAMPGVIPA